MEPTRHEPEVDHDYAELLAVELAPTETAPAEEVETA